MSDHKSRRNILLTGIIDVDQEILLHMNDTDIANIHSINKYVAKLCNDDYFWKRRLELIFRADPIKYKEETISYRQMYKIVKHNATVTFTPPLMYAFKFGYTNILKYILEELHPEYSAEYSILLWSFNNNMRDNHIDSELSKARTDVP